MGTNSQGKFFSTMDRSTWWCCGLSSLYIVLIFILPARAATVWHYHLNDVQFKLATAAIAIPTIAVWFAAFWAYAAMRKYAAAIQKTNEGTHFSKLAFGCAWLAWGLPVATIINFVLNRVALTWSSLSPSSIIIANYIALIIPLIAFVIINAAASGLVQNVRFDIRYISARLTMLFFLLAGTIYCYSIFRRLDPSSLFSTHNPYFLPVWLMIITIIIPYLYAWFIGLFSVYDITLFSIKIRGLIYRKALLLVACGLTAVILSSIALQYASSVDPRTNNLRLDAKTLLILLFRIIGGIGFFMLALGANRLKKIEEV